MAQNEAVKTMISMQMPVELRDELRRLAGEHDRSVSAEVRSAVRAHLTRSRSPVHAMTVGEGRGGAAAVPVAARREDAE